jgi:hypothetical protein
MSARAAEPGRMAGSTRGFDLRIMDVAAENRGDVLDLDRLIWQDGVSRRAVEDGMHLSPADHRHGARAFTARRFSKDIA